MKPAADVLEPLALVDSPRQETEMVERQIQALGARRGALAILEAGCGNHWPLKLADVRYELTGVDLNEDALRIRKYKRRDLDRIIQGDLRSVALKDGEYDVVYNSFVLEHVQQAEQVLHNFLRWLKPGGLLILRIPDPDSVYGFLSRVTPFWFHVFYKRYVAGMKMAGKPGYDPFPTVYDEVVGRAGIRRWCAQHGLKIREEVGWDYRIAHAGLASMITRCGIGALHGLSLGRLASGHVNLTYVIEKPAAKNAPYRSIHHPQPAKNIYESVSR